MNQQKSEGHICFREGYEYFWVLEVTGRKFVARAPISNVLDVASKQRIGARFEGTEAWFLRYGSMLTGITK